MALRFPIIRDAMAGNGNPEPVFHTDKDQILFLVTLPCHSELLGTMSLTKSLTKFLDLIDFLKEEKTRKEILSFLGLANQTNNFTLLK